MSTQSSRKKRGAAAGAAEKATRQLPQVNGTPRQAPSEASQEAKGAAEPGLGPVPQETVPMPIPAWPKVEPVDEVPSKPPPLRRPEKERYSPSGSDRRQPWPQRTGLLTSELRRALPPWALPLSIPSRSACGSGPASGLPCWPSWPD